jgi:peptidyl-prolyl cis-trans isomerase D
MQIIQNIREKGAAIIIVVIALSLIGFLLMDAKQGSNKLFSASNTDFGSVNGSKIDKDEFTKKVKNAEAQQEQQQQRKLSAAESAQVRDQVWNQMTAEKIFYAEADKLGINFTPKELTAILSSNTPDNPLLQDKNMIDPATGMLDQAKIKEALTSIKKSKGEQRDQIEAQVIDPQKIGSISQKYFGMLNAAAYYPTWMEEQDKKDAKSFATISYVAVPYNVISDSTIKVTDAEVDKYVATHKDLFKQEAGRKISYVVFSQLPSATDSTKIKDIVQGLKENFQADNNPKVFVARNSSAIPFDSMYHSKSTVQSTKLDSILKLPQGTVYGPYVDYGAYVLAKVLDSKVTADSAKARHILIATMDAQSGNPIMSDSAAKKLADSILTAINGGADFAAMAKQYSTDPGSKDKGGVYESFAYGQMVPEFNDFAFTKATGARGVVKTQFGYHVMEAMGTKGSSAKYKIAFVAKEIISSEETINNASNEATKASSEKDAAKLDAYLKAKGLNKITTPNPIKENDYSIGQLQDARGLVRWAFEAKKGEVSEPFSIGDQFVVATLDKIYAEGTQDAATARPMAERDIKNEKKAAEITKKIGATPTLESAAAAYQQQVQIAGADSSITFNGQIINGIGNEPKVFGAAFNAAYQTKVTPPIVGKSGVYVIKVNSIGQKADLTPEAATAIRKAKIENLRNAGLGERDPMTGQPGWIKGLIKQATIKDNRSKFY